VKNGMIQSETKHIDKKEYTLTLLKNHISYEEIQKQLKKKYNSGMSNRDLSTLRKQIKEKELPKNLDTYQNAFLKFYESLLSLKEFITDDDIISEIQEYHDLYYETRKELTIKNLPKDLRNTNVINSILESLEELKQGNYIYFNSVKNNNPK
jgi:hypothetical protein